MDSTISIIVILFCTLHLYFFFTKPLFYILFRDKVKTIYTVLIQACFQIILICLSLLGWHDVFTIVIICIMIGIPLNIVSSIITVKDTMIIEPTEKAEIVYTKTVYINCPKCGKEINKANERCPKCGFVFEKKEYCPSCDAEINKSSKFCPSCGKRLKVDEKIINYESEYKTCYECGTMQTKKEAMYCRKCGKAL